MMKKVVAIVLTLAVICSLPLAALAENAAGSEKFMDGYLQYKDDLLQILSYKDEYHHTMEGFEMDEDAMVMYIYELFVFYRNYDCGYDEMVRRAEAEAVERKPYWRYAVMSDEKLQFVAYDPQGLGVYVMGGTEEEYTYLTDIKNMTKSMEICGVRCEVERVVCFDMEASHRGTLVYIDTDKGVFVRYYDYYAIPAVEMTEAEYQSIAEQYCNYLDSIQWVGPDGANLGGGVSFGDFIKDPIIVEPSDQNKNEETEGTGNKVENLPADTETEGGGNQNTEPKSDKDGKANALVWIIPAAAAVVLLGGALAFITYRKKKT